MTDESQTIAIYARHSTDKQATSSTDQIDVLRSKLTDDGHTNILVCLDEGISGKAIANRPGIKMLLEAVSAGIISQVWTEALDRISRDQEEIAKIYKQLEYFDTPLFTLSEGKISELHIGLKGTMNAMQLKDIAYKTKRGQVAKVRKGYSGGGRCYGYDSIAKGELAINQGQAEIITRIYKMYGEDRMSARTIAHTLNSQGIAAPRGREWRATTLHGSRRAQDGILHQTLYIGVRIYNRRTYKKHYEAGTRTCRLNEPSLHIKTDVPQLAFIPEPLWNAVQARLKEISDKPANYSRKPKRLLSGLLKCQICEGPMTLRGGKYNCTRHYESKTCTNSKIIKAETVEMRLLAGVKEQLLQPEAISIAIKAYHDASRSAVRQINEQRVPMEKELLSITRKLEKAQEMYMKDLIDIDRLQSMTKQIEVRKSELTAKLAHAASPQVIQLHPNAGDAYRRLAEELHMALEGEDSEAIRGELRKLIEKVIFIPQNGLGKFELEVHGNLATILAAGRPQNAKNPTGETCEVMLGAGVGFEPTTFRL